MTTFVCNSQFLATFRTTSSKHTATVSSSHSLEETMFVTTLALRWLECTFHSAIVCIYALSRGLIIYLRITILAGGDACVGSYFSLVLPGDRTSLKAY